MHIVSIGRTSLSGFALKRMVFSARYGLKIASFNAWSEYFSSGLRGFVREYITSVEASSGTKSILQTNPGSVSKNIKFSNQFCSEANWKKENLVSTIYKVKQEINGGSVSNPLMPRMNYVKEGMQAEPRDEEDLNVREGDVINLPNLLFTENRDYLVKYNDDQKVRAAQLVGKAILLYFVPSEDDEAAKQPSLETLLASPVRNYVISNKEDKVPIHTLKDKVRRIEILPNFYPLLELMIPSLKLNSAFGWYYWEFSSQKKQIYKRKHKVKSSAD
ncbi:hypothetical protein POM88_047958 [Heracleum sosnowskyi]|uniref:Uncharacterized protein n=1 Tax=Heracleum sosnowskyi TaxID=360622 RepID=A0AAD8GUT3_9APIA|nr:hypothetical protein POM88_047958 [Heracleum sosnowskyi]